MNLWILSVPVMIGASSIPLGSLRMRSQKQPPEVFLEILQNSQENTCARVSFLIKLKARPATLLKKRIWCGGFPVNFAKFLRTPFLTEDFRWLFLWFANLQKSSAELMIIWPDFTWQNTTFLIVSLIPSMALYHDGLHYKAYRSGNRDGRWKSA